MFFGVIDPCRSCIRKILKYRTTCHQVSDFLSANMFILDTFPQEEKVKKTTILFLAAERHFCKFSKIADRSWARKAKGTGPKKRPALLTADFLLERDRATPCPVVEVKGSCSAPEEESKKDKVESWLKGSEFTPTITESRKPFFSSRKLV